jgi:hypothetical protein
MEVEFDFFFGELVAAGGKAEREAEALAQLLRVAGDSDSLCVGGDVVAKVASVALASKSAGVRALCVRVLVALLHSKGSRAAVLRDEVSHVAMLCAGDPSALVASLRLLAALAESERDELVDALVRRGGLDLLVKHLSAQPGTDLASLPLARELSLKGVASLALHPAYAVRLHERDIWSHLMRLYEESYVSPLSLKVVKNVLLGCIAAAAERADKAGKTDRADEADKADEASQADKADKPPQPPQVLPPRVQPDPPPGAPGESTITSASTSTSTPRLSVSRAMRDSRSRLRQQSACPDEATARALTQRLADAMAEVEAQRGRGRTRDGFSEEEGLLREQYLEEQGLDKLDLAATVCMNIDRKGIMGMLMRVCQTPEQEAMAELALTIVGLLSGSLHRVLTRDNRIVVVRVLLSLVEFYPDKRVVAAAHVLDLFLGQRANRGIVLHCGAAQKCANLGSKLLTRKDGTSVKICQAMTQVLFHISSIPDGPAELSNAACIAFLRKSLKNIGAVELRRNDKGEETWSSHAEIGALVTLINVATQSPIMSSVTAAELHKALAAAAKRTDELGLLAVLGSALFLAKAGPSSRSREIPRMQAPVVDMLTRLLRASRDDAPAPAPGGIDWTTEELLKATCQLVQAPHNLYEMRPLLPSIVDTLRDVVERGEETNAGLAVDILLEMSYNKHVARQLAGETEIHDVLDRALDVVHADHVRPIETLIQSLRNEAEIDSREAAAAAAALKLGGDAAAAPVASPAAVKDKILSLGRTSLRLAMRGAAPAGQQEQQQHH